MDIPDELKECVKKLDRIGDQLDKLSKCFKVNRQMISTIQKVKGYAM